MFDLDDIKENIEEENKKEKKTRKRSEFKDLYILYCGWGVQPDQYVFAEVIACGINGREITCRLAKKEEKKSGGKGFRLVPGETYGEPFKLHKSRSRKGKLCFKGRYPFESGKKKDGMKKGKFYPYEGEVVTQED